MNIVNEFLKEAPSGTARVLQALSLAESLTDRVAKEIYEIEPIEGVPANLFLEAIHQSNFIVPRNSEWYFVDDFRAYFHSLEEANRERLIAVHQLLLNQAKECNIGLAGDEIPAYLFSKTGFAYHKAAIGDVNESLALYAEIAKGPPSGERWLAGVLSEEQQKYRVLPDDAIEPSFLRGMGFYNEKKFVDAERYLRRVISSTAQRIEVSIATHLVGKIEVRRGHFDEALVLFNRSITLSEDLHERLGLSIVLNSRGGVKCDIGDLDGALDDFNRVIELDFKRAVAIALNGRSVVKRILGDLDGALKDLNRAVNLGDHHTIIMSLSNRWAVKMDIGDLDGALIDIDRIVELGDANTVAKSLSVRAAVKRDLGDLAGALKDLDLLLKMLSTRRFDVDRQTIKKRHKQLLTLQNKLIRASSDEKRQKLWRDYLFEIAKNYLTHSENPIRAITLLKRVMELDVGHELYPGCMFSFGKLYFKLNRIDEAVPYFQKAIETGWEGSEVRATLAHALTQLGKTLEETQSLYESAIAQVGETSWAKSWFALALSAAGEHATAEIYGRAAVAKPPNDRNAVLLFNLARVLDATGDPIKQEEAIVIAKQSADLAHPRFKQPKQFLAER